METERHRSLTRSSGQSPAAFHGLAPRTHHWRADSLDSGQTRVVLRLGRSRRIIDVNGHADLYGEGTKVPSRPPEGVLRGPEAEGRLIQQMWKEAAIAANPAEALAMALTRSVYLQQDLVRDFIDSVTAQERFSAVSELVGAGTRHRFTRRMERAKKSMEPRPPIAEPGNSSRFVAACPQWNRDSLS